MNMFLVILSLMVSEKVPSDFFIKYEYVAGTVPPPYHYEYIVEIDADGRGRIVFYPDYSSATTPCWEKTFIVESDTVLSLYQMVEKSSILKTKWKEPKERPVGGSHEYLKVVSSGKSTEVPPFATNRDKAKEVIERVKSLVPKSIMEELMQEREKYMDSYKRQ